jgi:Ca2+-binding RTX toxin-like protein
MRAIGGRAMATITYDWQIVKSGFFVNSDPFGDEGSAAIGGTGKHGFFAAWEPGSTAFLNGRAFGRTGDPLASDFQVNTTTANEQYDVSIAGQASGRALMTFTDLSGDHLGDIRGRLYRADGTAVGEDFAIVANGTAAYDSDAAALADGGYAVSWTRDFNGDGDYDVHVQVLNANGTTRGGAIPVEQASTLRTDYSTVAGLAGGGFVVGWQQGLVEGGTDTVAFVRYDAAGTRLDTNPVIIDNIGTYKQDLQAVGLQDGGFAFAYVDDGYTTDTLEITLRIYKPDGFARTGYILANGDETDGDQLHPTITTLGNGYIVVGWTDGDALKYQAFDPDGNRVGDIENFSVFVTEGELAGLTGGQMVNVRSSTFEDDDGDSIRGSIEELTRTVTGNAASETLNGDGLADHLIGLGGRDRMNGFAGRDTLEGGVGDDLLRGGLDRDQLIGGGGADSFIFQDARHSRAGVGDFIKDFQDGVDHIDVSAIDARAASPATNQAFTFIVGSFTAEGQVRVVQDGADTLVQFNTTGTSGAEMEIVVKNFDAGDFSGTDFVL